MTTAIPPAGRLRCDRCGCSMDVSPDDMVRFTHGEWPRCCLLPMTLDVDDHLVRPTAGTDLERPPRPARKTYRG